MSKQLNIDEILAKHGGDEYFGCTAHRRGVVNDAIKEILEQYTEIVVENAELPDLGLLGPDCEQSIRSCLNMVTYE